MQSNRQRDFGSEDDAYHSTRKETIRADLARRLRNICANLSEEEFCKLVEKMTSQQMRSERRPF